MFLKKMDKDKLLTCFLFLEKTFLFLAILALFVPCALLSVFALFAIMGGGSSWAPIIFIFGFISSLTMLWGGVAILRKNTRAYIGGWFYLLIIPGCIIAGYIALDTPIWWTLIAVVLYTLFFILRKRSYSDQA